MNIGFTPQLALRPRFGQKNNPAKGVNGTSASGNDTSAEKTIPVSRFDLEVLYFALLYVMSPSVGRWQKFKNDSAAELAILGYKSNKPFGALRARINKTLEQARASQSETAAVSKTDLMVLHFALSQVVSQMASEQEAGSLASKQNDAPFGGVSDRISRLLAESDAGSQPSETPTPSFR